MTKLCSWSNLFVSPYSIFSSNLPAGFPILRYAVNNCLKNVMKRLFIWFCESQCKPICLKLKVSNSFHASYFKLQLNYMVYFSKFSVALSVNPVNLFWALVDRKYRRTAALLVDCVQCNLVLVLSTAERVFNFVSKLSSFFCQKCVFDFHSFFDFLWKQFRMKQNPPTKLYNLNRLTSS